jgi:hypothetical protein
MTESAMSSEMHVLFAGRLPGAKALTRAMKELGFPLSIKAVVGALDRHSGFLPMRLRREDTGVEFDVFDEPADVAEVAGADADPRFTRSANFRWGGDEDEMLCAMCMAAALAKLVGGMVADENEERLLTPDETIAFARKHLEAVKPLAGRPRGTRPADIRHYLKPLLEMRSDLVLAGRLLLVRPVRHLLRGVLFERLSKDRFRLWRYIQPLYDGSEACGYGHFCHPAAVWQPHFEPLLIDFLATNVFDDLGQMTTLEAFAEMVARDCRPPWTSWDNCLGTPITGLVLAGEQDRAASCAQEFERKATYESVKDWIRAHWERTTTDVPALCAKMRAREAAMVEALKLDRIWEPSPFPVEVPRAERAAKSAEPVFPITPWIAPPPGLWGDLPSEPDEVRFAKDLTRRGHGLSLLVPLTRDEAEARHRAVEDYVAVAQLRDGPLFVIWLGGRDRNDPDILTYVPTWKPRQSFQIQLRGKSALLSIRSSTDWDGAGVVALHAVEAFEGAKGSVWLCNIDLKENKKQIHDSRSGEKVYTISPLGSAERELAMCPIPAFGEYVELAPRLRKLVQVLGYGDLT